MQLGQLIRELEPIARAEPKRSVVFDFGGFAPTKLDSYRGFYEQLALGYDTIGTTTVRDLLEDAKSALGGRFEGYKGGTYKMCEDTPIWIANYGESHQTVLAEVYRAKYEIVLRTRWEDI